MEFRSSPRTLSQKLAVYGLGVGAASLATSGNADIVYSGPVEFSGNTIIYDLQNIAPPATVSDGVNHDFQLSKFKVKASSSDDNTNTTSTGYTDFVTRNSSSYAIQHFAGDVIGSSGNFGSNTLLQNAYPGGIFPAGANAGDWNPGERGFLGLKLIVGTDTFFGWADVTLNNLDGSGSGAFTLHSYAYDNTPGTAITAGVIPEPSTIALLAAGAAGVMALKRRKK